MPCDAVEALGSSEADMLAAGAEALGCCVADGVPEPAADPPTTGVDEADRVAPPVVDGAGAPDPQAPTIKPAITTRLADPLAADLENVLMDSLRTTVCASEDSVTPEGKDFGSSHEVSVLEGPLASNEGPSAAVPASRLHTFRADVTIPVGHPCMGGGISPAKVIVDPLEAIGFVLAGGTLEKPVVFVSVDWCEIRNDSYDAWRDSLAEVASTDRERVFVTAIHQHDAPVVDAEAQRILEERGLAGAVCDIEFADAAIRNVASALTAALDGPAARVTHLGTGRAKVDSVSSNRRFVRPDGTVSYHRTSASDEPDAHAADEGLIDPWLRTLSLWDGDRPLLALSTYAVHPMSYYGQGEVSADFMGIARRARQAALPDIVQIYASGCSGNVTAGKYNDGARENRAVLAGRVEAAMAAAWLATVRVPLAAASFRSVPLVFEPRTGAGHTPEDLDARLAPGHDPFDQCRAAMAVSWRRRIEAGRPIDLPVLELGPAVVALLPGEAYVEYQLLAQRLRPDAFVLALGYGESATGYIPTATQIAEGDENLGDWYWVSETAEDVLATGLRAALT